MKINKLKLLFICIICYLFNIVSCATIETTGPYTRQNLIDQGLIKESSSNRSKLRIVYPQIAQDEFYRELMDRYINRNPEIQSFLSEGSNIHAQSETSEINKLGIYFYEISNRQNIISLAIQAEYILHNEKQFETWFTLNFQTHEKKAFSYSYLFEDTDQVLLAISNFVQTDITRQKRLRQIDITEDPFLTMDTKLFTTLLNSFVLLPSNKSSNKYTGIRIYLNRIGKKEEGMYASNVPTSVFKSFLNPEIASKFIDENLPLIIEDPTRQRISTFPDLIQDF